MFKVAHLGGSNRIERDYRAVWLRAHPYVNATWLDDKIKEGFNLHHVDGNRQNNTADNLLLIFGPDHHRLHKFERRIGLINAAQHLAKHFTVQTG